MKKNVLLFTFLLFTSSVTLYAQTPKQDYRQMVQDGVTWETQVGGIMENVYGYFINGDTLINGENWKKAYSYICLSFFENSYYCAIREIDKKVYAIAKDCSKPRLLYDFGLKEGDLIACGVEGTNFCCLLDPGEDFDMLLGFPFVTYLKVEKIDIVKYNEQAFRRFSLTLLDSYREKLLMAEPVVWIEGIGSGAGPFSVWMPMPTSDIFTRCKMGNNTLFRFPINLNDDNQETVMVRNTTQETIKSMGGYNINGLRFTNQSHGVYIENGKKRLVK